MGMTIGEARKQFAHTWSNMVYLNHAAISPMSFRVRDAVGKYLERRSLKGIEPYPWAQAMLLKTKTLLGLLLHCDAQDIAFVLNTSDGLNVLASGLEWKQGDRVLLNSLEFPSNVYPFLNLERLGVVVDFVEPTNGRITPEAIEAKITDRTKLVSLSFVQFLTGERADVEKIGAMLRARGILFAVDAIQGIPHIAINVVRSHIDFLASGSHKWLMAVEGTGFIYVGERARTLIRQASLGWTSIENPFDFTPRPEMLREGAARYENGTLNFAAIAGLKAALEFFFEFGQAEAEARVLELSGYLIDRLSSRGVEVITPKEASARAGIVTFEFADAESVHKRLLEKEIVISIRNGKLRASPHFYNTEDEVRALYLALFD